MRVADRRAMSDTAASYTLDDVTVVTGCTTRRAPAPVSLLVGERVHDTASGTRAYRHDVVEVPIEYDEHPGEAKLDPLEGVPRYSAPS